MQHSVRADGSRRNSHVGREDESDSRSPVDFVAHFRVRGVISALDDFGDQNDCKKPKRG